MTNTNEKETATQEKKSTRKNYRPMMPWWIHTRQDWISDQARRLLQVLISLADFRSGNLLVPNKNWITLKVIQKRAGMCERTRKDFMWELRELGFVRMEQARVRHKNNSRLRVVAGQAHYTVLRHVFENPNINMMISISEKIQRERLARKQRRKRARNSGNASNRAASTAVQHQENINPEPQSSVSSAVQHDKENAKNEKTDSSAVQLLHGATVAPISTVFNHRDAGAGAVSSSTGNTSASGATGNREQVQRAPVVALAVEKKQKKQSSSSSNCTNKPEHDDDECVICSKTIKPKKQIDPVLRRFAKQRVMERIREMDAGLNGPDNLTAYLHTCLENFMESIEEETETYLAEQAEKYLDSRVRNGTVPKRDVLVFLAGTAMKHHLPFDESMGWRAIQTAADILGLEEKPLNPAKVN